MRADRAAGRRPLAARFDLDVSVAEDLRRTGRPGGLRGIGDRGGGPVRRRRRRERVRAAAGAGAGGGGRRPAGAGCSEVEVLDAAERRQVLAEWNDTAAAVPAGDGAGAVRGAGGADAGRGGGGVRGRLRQLRRSWTRRASRLARRAGRRGARARSRWWRCCLERSAELVVALLAVLQGRGGVPAGGPGATRPSGSRSCWPTPARRGRDRRGLARTCRPGPGAGAAPMIRAGRRRMPGRPRPWPTRRPRPLARRIRRT